MTEKMHIVYDLDDTLAHFTEGFVYFMQTQVLGEDPVPIEYPPNYHLMVPFQDKTDLTAEQALLLYEASGTMKLMWPTDISKMYHMCTEDPIYETTILTARGWMKNPMFSVHDWLDHWSLPEPDVIKIVGLRESKAHYVANLKGTVCSVFDDNPRHLNEYMANNSKGAIIFAANQPWNQDSPCHTRLNTRNLIGEDRV